MAWLKVEHNTIDKPEMSLFSKRCNCSMDVAFASWFRLWRHFDLNCSDGFVKYFDQSDADRISGLTGFSDALQEAGWLEFTDQGCQIINWERHNGKSAKTRALTAERKRRHDHKDD